MAETLKVLGQAAPLATTETDLYTVPSSTAAIVSSLIITNRGSTSTTFRVSASQGGGATANKDYLGYDTLISGNANYEYTVGISLAATDKLRVYAGNANLSFNMFGLETDILQAKILGQAAPLAATETDLYTVPASIATLGSTVIITNRGSASATFRVSASVGGGATANKDYVGYDTFLVGNSNYEYTIAWSLAATDKIRVYASNANLSFNMFGKEIPV